MDIGVILGEAILSIRNGAADALIPAIRVAALIAALVICWRLARLWFQ